MHTRRNSDSMLVGIKALDGLFRQGHILSTAFTKEVWSDVIDTQRSAMFFSEEKDTQPKVVLFLKASPVIPYPWQSVQAWVLSDIAHSRYQVYDTWSLTSGVPVWLEGTYNYKPSRGRLGIGPKRIIQPIRSIYHSRIGWLCNHPR